MSFNDDKRHQRELKREVKKAGNRKRRRQLGRDLARDPETAHETEFEFGRDSSAGFNGLDNDATRKRKSSKKPTQEGEDA
ncbi:MAG: hypothetical protein ACKO23_04520 [Gemmataceae bacterium]